MKYKFQEQSYPTNNNYNVIIHVLPFENIKQIIHRKMNHKSKLHHTNIILWHLLITICCKLIKSIIWHINNFIHFELISYSFVKLNKSLNSLYKKKRKKHSTSILFIEQEESTFLLQDKKI